MSDLSKGDKVSWKTPQGKTEGTVEQKVTNDTSIKGHTVSASEDEPQFKVKSDKSGSEAVHKPDSLDKK